MTKERAGARPTVPDLLAWADEVVTTGEIAARLGVTPAMFGK